ncbi:ABC-2 type transport system permease protein [Thermosporothrix hazakensis]|jgi:ABC-2 type transport system permease protein|uniref:ABC-2 type transport system permease protein n=2 Tax=Thermosporothrix TaxID=768650 RepID=A0A326U4R6_THEHA|nr:ABC transporter permease [Thermosporothrix hazakensis]PZW28003.1 ABC-2 type transport system permease protein [Thermosporothrix hazakensis]BBH86934.1 hypothetical protein KTC_16850 [Thermosporothrix sp. COM3]GCE51225.1 hypothetical protein KTH_60940 [Thermosporothrix hazakensis]
MKTLWAIAKKDIMHVVKDKTALLLMIAVPLAVITVIGLAFSSLFNANSGQLTISVALSDQDNATVGKAIKQALNIHTKDLDITITTYPNAERVRQQVEASNESVGIVIPTGASEAINKGASQAIPSDKRVQFYTLPNNSSDARVNVIRMIVDKVLQTQLISNESVRQVYQVCNQPGNHCAPNTINGPAISGAVIQATNATENALQPVSAGKAPEINTFDQVIPGYAIFFALFGLNSVAATILQEKESGTFRRLLIAPIHKYALLGGKLLAQFVVTLVQIGIIFAIGYFVFHMHVPDWPALILLLFGTSFAATGLGILIVSLVRSRRQINPVVTLVTLVTSALGGSWWPLYMEPEWMRNVARVGITAWAMEGLNNSMLFGKSFMEVLPNIIALFVYGLICFLIALRFFRFQEKTAAA